MAVLLLFATANAQEITKEKKPANSSPNRLKPR